MRFCSKCGNVIKDTEKCCSVCGQSVTTIAVRNVANDEMPYPIPDVYSVPEKKKSNAGATLVAFILFIGIAAFIVGMINYKGNKNIKSNDTGGYNSYDDALDALADGLTKANGKAICHSMLTDKMMDSITQEQFDAMSDTFSLLNGTVSKAIDEKAGWSFDSKSSVKLSDDKIAEIKYYYSSHVGMDIDIEEAYQVKVNMKFGNQSDQIYVNVIKVPNEGWKVSEEFINSLTGSFD